MWKKSAVIFSYRARRALDTIPSRARRSRSVSENDSTNVRAETYFILFMKSLGYDTKNQPGGLLMKLMNWMLCAAIVALGGGCTSTSWNNALGTPKNPSAIYADPNSKYRDDDNAFIVANYRILLEAIEQKSEGAPKLLAISKNYDVRRYLSAGYTLSDMYCSRYFRKSDESSRRRKFGRSVTNDVGTAITTVLGLANAGQDAVAALAAGTGLADSSWRNYDDSFMISPELSSVQGLVEAAQDNYRSKTLGKSADMPADFSTAQHMIQRYANLCSHLGMKRLVQESATREQKTLNADTDQRNANTSSPIKTATENIAGAKESATTSAAPLSERPTTALPVPATNQP